MLLHTQHQAGSKGKQSGLKYLGEEVETSQHSGENTKVNRSDKVRRRMRSESTNDANRDGTHD